MRKKEKDLETPVKRKQRPGMSVEARENQLISLAVVLFGYRPLTKEILSEAALDLIVHIVCLFTGCGVILCFDRLFGEETKNEKTL